MRHKPRNREYDSPAGIGEVYADLGASNGAHHELDRAPVLAPEVVEEEESRPTPLLEAPADAPLSGVPSALANAPQWKCTVSAELKASRTERCRVCGAEASGKRVACGGDPA